MDDVQPSGLHDSEMGSTAVGFKGAESALKVGLSGESGVRR
jgi:hypothetical protein